MQVAEMALESKFQYAEGQMHPTIVQTLCFLISCSSQHPPELNASKHRLSYTSCCIPETTAGPALATPCESLLLGHHLRRGKQVMSACECAQLSVLCRGFAWALSLTELALFSP